MPWVFLGLAVGCVAVAMTTQSIGLALVALMLALGFMLLGALGIVSARIQGRSQSSASMLSGDALATMRKVREAAEPGVEQQAEQSGDPSIEDEDATRTEGGADVEDPGESAPTETPDDVREPAR